MSKSQKVPAEKIKLQTPEFRVSWPHVFEPRKIKPTDKPKYSVTMLFRVSETPKSKELGEKVVSIQELKDTVRLVVEQKWGTDPKKRPENLKLPFRSILKPEDKSKKDTPGYDEGVVFVEASSDATTNPRPGIVFAHAVSKTDPRPAPLTVPSDFYAGCYARATINAYAWEYMGKHGISFGLQNLQKLRDGEPFGGRKDAASDFDAAEVPAGGPEAVGAAADPTGL